MLHLFIHFHHIFFVFLPIPIAHECAYRNECENLFIDNLKIRDKLLVNFDLNGYIVLTFFKYPFIMHIQDEISTVITTLSNSSVTYLRQQEPNNPMRTAFSYTLNAQTKNKTVQFDRLNEPKMVRKIDCEIQVKAN